MQPHNVLPQETGNQPSRAISFAACRRLTRAHAKSFYFSSHTLPRDKREASYAIYAYCRYVDDTIDLASTPGQAVQAMHRLRDDLQSRHFPLDWGMAFLATVERYGIPWSYFEDLLVGVAMDQSRVRLKTWEELERYCYHVASVVGLMMTHLFTRPTPDLLARAQDLGTAMQLTNILRDIAEDWERDRIYLPSQEMERFGVGEQEIAQGQMTESLQNLMRFQIERAREYYRRSESGIRQLPQDGSQLTVWMMREIYAGILEEIEKANLNPFKGRVRTNAWRKVQLGFRALRKSQKASE